MCGVLIVLDRRQKEIVDFVYGVEPEKILVIHNGVDVAMFLIPR